MSNGYMKKCSKLLVTKEMKIKTLTKDHFTLTRMVVIKKAKDIKYW